MVSRDQLDKILENKQKENFKNYSAMILADQKESLTKQKEFEMEKQRKQFRDNILSYKLLTDNEQLRREREDLEKMELSMGRTIEESMLKRSQEYIQNQIRLAKEKKMQNKEDMDAMLSDIERKKMRENADYRRRVEEYQRMVADQNREFDLEQNRRRQNLHNRFESINHRQKMFQENALPKDLGRENEILTKIERDELIARRRAREDEETRLRMKMQVKSC